GARLQGGRAGGDEELHEYEDVFAAVVSDACRSAAIVAANRIDVACERAEAGPVFRDRRS
ncbi:hypothetical protein, partial [Burkholderia multivorans]|uniref:hypothetical protein n=1 Tax=Burkholderia multivorans TaxID=87883 RepID=UPI001C612782